MRKLLILALAAMTLAVPVARATPYDQVLDTVQQMAFNYMWTEANATTGMIRDRSQSGSPCSIAALGFGLSSICVGIDHGWVTRAQGAARVQAALNNLWTTPQGTATSGTSGYKGFYYHFLDMTTGLRMPGWNPELSDIDTALLLAGVLDCEQYFNGGDPVEVNIRSLADQIYRRVDWTFFQHPTQNGLMIQWAPESGFNTGVWRGYNEMMIMYILAMGSPTHAVPAADWNTYTSGYVYGTQYGQTYVQYAALFTHQYSHCWIDFRNKRDTYMQGIASDYFQNSRKATLAQQAYCVANPGSKFGTGQAGFDVAAYTSTFWGLTAGDGPNGHYDAHGAPGPGTFDDGTVQPTAPVSSVAFAPEICLPTIQNLYDNHPLLWGTYGFRDGLNKTRSPDWYDTDFLGIDQGPMVMMIENYRNASIWLRFMQNPYVQAGMTAAGFVATVDVPAPPPSFAQGVALSASPNPFSSQTVLRYRLPVAAEVRLTVHDVAGREVATLVKGQQEAGEHTARFDAESLSSGVYWYRLETPGAVVTSRGVKVR
jgi:hypothetical protein